MSKILASAPVCIAKLFNRDEHKAVIKQLFEKIKKISLNALQQLSNIQNPMKADGKSKYNFRSANNNSNDPFPSDDESETRSEVPPYSSMSHSGSERAPSVLDTLSDEDGHDISQDDRDSLPDVSQDCVNELHLLRSNTQAAAGYLSTYFSWLFPKPEPEITLPPEQPLLPSGFPVARSHDSDDDNLSSNTETLSGDKYEIPQELLYCQEDLLDIPPKQQTQPSTVFDADDSGSLDDIDLPDYCIKEVDSEGMEWFILKPECYSSSQVDFHVFLKDIMINNPTGPIHILARRLDNIEEFEQFFGHIIPPNIVKYGVKTIHNSETGAISSQTLKLIINENVEERGHVILNFDHPAISGKSENAGKEPAKSSKDISLPYIITKSMKVKIDYNLQKIGDRNGEKEFYQIEFASFPNDGTSPLLIEAPIHDIVATIKEVVPPGNLANNFAFKGLVNCGLSFGVHFSGSVNKIRFYPTQDKNIGLTEGLHKTYDAKDPVTGVITPYEFKTLISVEGEIGEVTLGMLNPGFFIRTLKINKPLEKFAAAKMIQSFSFFVEEGLKRFRWHKDLEELFKD